MPDNFLGKIKDALNPPKVEKPYEGDGSDHFTPEEQKSIVKMIIQDIEADEKVQMKWRESKKKSLMHKNCAKPSLIEGISKKSWQSDRNLGIGPAVADTYQSTLIATCWNPDSIHFVATEENDIDNKDNLEKFTKAIIGKDHADVTPEIDDFIQNKIDLGFSIFEIYREVTYDWIERDIPKYDKEGKLRGYDRKVEKIRIERGVMENIDNIDDVLMPRYGDNIQKLPHIMRVIHMTGDDIVAAGKEGKFINVDSKMVNRFKMLADLSKDGLEKERAEDLDLADVVDEEFRALPIDIYKWYGWIDRKGKREKYRIHIERKTETFLAGKPLRKITKTGKYPFVGGPFDRIPGQLRGRDLYEMIADPINGINETFNQKADFQYVNNCPFGFHKAGEGYTKDAYDLEPGVSYPSEGNPAEEHYFPNIQRSMAWAEQDIRILFEVIEKRTGAATYFQTNERNASGTATRDMIVARQAETRFGKWVMRIQDEISEALTMLVNIYQEHMPDDLGKRILGEKDGKALFRNLSVESIRYNGDARMEPNVTAGSKAFEKEVMLWAFQALQSTIWLDPRINPKGNWLLVCRTMKSQGIAAPELYLPPEPKAEFGTGKDIDNIWTRIMQGEVVEVEPTWNIPQVITGLYKKKGEQYFELDPEYRPNLDKLIFELEVAYRELLTKLVEDQMAARLAQQAIASGQQNGGKINTPVPPPPAPGPMGPGPQTLPAGPTMGGAF